MPVKNSEMVRQRLEVGKAVKAGIDTYGDEIAVGHDAYLAADLREGETQPSTRTYLTLLSRKTDRAMGALEGLNSGVVDKARETGTVRSQVDQVTDSLTSKLRGTRHVCRGLLGQEFLERVGFTGDLPGTALGLYQFGRLVQSGLRDPNQVTEPVLSIPESGTGEDGEEVRSGHAPLATALADGLESELVELGGLVDDTHVDRREAVDVQSRRRDAIKAFDREMVTIVQAVRAVFRAAGREDLASRFRATYKRQVRSGAEETQEPAEPPVTEPPVVSDTPAS